MVITSSAYEIQFKWILVSQYKVKLYFRNLNFEKLQ